MNEPEHRTLEQIWFDEWIESMRREDAEWVQFFEAQEATP